MIISHTHQFIFIKTKKTAGTSIEVYLSAIIGESDVVTPVGVEEATAGHRPRNFGGHFSPIGEALGLLGAPDRWKEIDGGGAIRSLGHAVKGKRFYNHISAYRLKQRVGDELWGRYFTFAVERNPWDKAISQFYWKARRRSDYSFREFVEEGDVGVNYPRYCHPRTGEVMVDRILYYDRLNEGLTDLFGRLGVPFSGTLGVRAKGATRTDRKPYQELFSGELAEYRSTIDSLFAKEIALHGWNFETGTALRSAGPESNAPDGGSA